MAIIPLPFVGSQILLGAYARFRKKPNYECPDSYKPSIVAAIPAKNEAKRIPYALASLNLQTYRPQKVVVVDDGSEDSTAEVATLMRELLDLDIDLIRKPRSEGKTSAVKTVSRNYPYDKIFVLDADTLLRSPDYIEKLRIPHYSDEVASSFGVVRSITKKNRKTFFHELILALYRNKLKKRGSRLQEISEIISNVRGGVEQREGFRGSLHYYLYEWPIEKYREALYIIDQYLLKNSYMRAFSTTLFPIGCGVLYDRDKLNEVFDEFEPSLGDNLTTSEDIFLGFAFADRGFSNVQVNDTYMFSTEPPINRFPRQTYLWNSSFLQSSYYFKGMTHRFRGKKIRDQEKEQDCELSEGINTRVKKPLGWAILPQLAEGMAFPCILGGLAYLNIYYALIALGMEFGLYSLVNLLSAPRKKESLSNLALAEPIRVLSMPLNLFIFGKFGLDLIRRKRNWKK